MFPGHIRENNSTYTPTYKVSFFKHAVLMQTLKKCVDQFHDLERRVLTGNL